LNSGLLGNVLPLDGNPNCTFVPVLAGTLLCTVVL
jgi:hypothetical protein